MTYRIPLAFSSFGSAEIDAIHQVLASDQLTQGPEVARFERQLAQWNGVNHAIFVNSGSSANLLAIEAVIQLSRLRPDLLPTNRAIAVGDEAIIQGLNWPSTLKPLLNLGVRPVFCDVDIGSLNASVATVRSAMTERTRMVVAVPVLGNPSHLEELREFCAAEDILVVEDACESLGAITARGNKVGTIGTTAAYSFYFSHHLTTIEGGAVLTDSEELADMIYALRAHGWSRNLELESFLDFDSADIDPRFCFVLPGYNVRSTELNAVLGQVQLGRIDALIEARRRIAAGRIAALDGHPSGTRIPGADCSDRHSWMTTPILFASRDARLRGQEILEASGIETRPIIVGNVLRHPLARMLDLTSAQRELPVCDGIFDRGLMIGLNPAASIEDEAFVCDALRRAAHG